MTDRLHLSLLGTPQVIYKQEPLTGFISIKAEALLYYLAVTEAPHNRDWLASLLWSDMTQSAARKNLTKALSNLRKLTGDYLAITHQNATFKRDTDCWLDVRAFEAVATSNDVQSLQQAADLYRGDFLARFYLKDAPVFEEWLRTEQARLRSLMLETLEKLAQRLIMMGDYERAIEVVNQLLDLDSYRESAHRQLIGLLAQVGRRDAALAQYETCRRILAEELGVTPSTETELLYQRIKTSGTATPHNLPHATTQFVGRGEELTKIVQLLNTSSCRLLTIAGPGGIGKTRLALQATHHYTQQIATVEAEHGFPDGVYLVDLAPLNSIEAIISTLADASGFSFHREGASYGEGDPQQQLLNYLHHKRLLLILDNFEHFLPLPATATSDNHNGLLLITMILERAAGVKILVTSRSRLNLQGEHLYYLAGMPFPDLTIPAMNGEVSQLLKGESQPLNLIKTVVNYSAVQLFVNQARQVQPDFELTTENVLDVVQICQLVQGMPLAILLAVGWVEMLTPAEIAVEIARSLDFLETTMHNVPERQQSIRAAFDYSWNLLTQRERDVFQQLSVFRDRFSRQAAQSVTNASLKELMGLVNKSLLRRTDTGHYVAHELVRQYAAEKLDQSPEQSHAARDQHSAYYVAKLHQFEMDLKGTHQQAALNKIDAAGENIRTAWQWAIARQQTAWLQQAMDGLGYFYVRHGRYQEGELTFQSATAELSAESSPTTNKIRAKLTAWQAVFSHLLGRSEVARQLLQKALSIADDQSWLSIKAFALHHLGEVSREFDRQAARQAYEQSLALYQQLNDRWGTANALASLGWLIQHLGAYDEAKQLYSQSLTLRQQLDDHWGIADSLISLGSIALYQGYPEEAEQLVQQSIELHQTLGDRAGIAYSLSKLGETLIWLGQFAEAQTPLLASQTIYEDLGIRVEATFSIAMLANALIHLGDYEQAFEKAQSALSEFDVLDSQRGRAYALLMGGWAAIGSGDTETAQQMLEESRDIYQDIGQRDELAQAFALLGYVAYQTDVSKLAEQHLHTALQTAHSIQAFMPMMLALPALALLYLDQEKPTRSLELYTLASRYPLVTNSHWFRMMSYGRMATVDLSPDVLLTVEKRVETKALLEMVAEIM